MNPHKGYMFPFACFTCRRSFKRRYEPDIGERPCPHCGGIAVRLSRKFKAPRADNVEQWEKVALLVEHGFRFETIQNPDRTSVAYPRTLAEARRFVLQFRS